jgi:hypothetical protein
VRSLLKRLQSLCAAEPGASPLCDAHVTLAFSAVTTSCAKILRGSLGAAASHFFDPHTQATEAPSARNVPENMISSRGGADFFSGTAAGSRILTLGVSLASYTLANSYCSVSSS